MKKYLPYILLLFVTLAKAQDTTVQWLDFETVKDRFLKKQKPILIFAYEPGNELCEKIDSVTFSNPEVAKYINVLFYPIKFDITTKDTLTFFDGKKFKHLPQQKYHSLAKFFFGDSISVPSLVVFGKNAQGQVFYGYKNRDSIFPVLIYYAEDVYLSNSYKEWEKYYFKAYPPGMKQIITRLKIHWLTMDEMLEKQKTQPRKVLIDIYNNYNVAQTVMRLQVYNNPQIASYLNTHFYPVTLPLRSEDTIKIKGKIFVNAGGEYKYHQLAISFLGGKMKFPAFVILDENLDMLDRIQQFMTVKQLEPVIHFYGDNRYKSMKYKDFLEQWDKDNK